jgi:hypothetical protein
MPPIARVPPSARILVSAVVLCGIGLGSCGRREQAPEDDVLAIVGEHRIRMADLEQELERRRAANRPVESAEALLADMVRYEALAQRARQLGIDRDPELQRSVDNLLIGMLRERELTPQIEAIEVTDDEVTAAYRQDPGSFAIPGRLHLAVIKVDCPPTSSEAKRVACRARIEKALRLARDPEAGFAAAAAECSDDQASRYRGGDIGWVDPAMGHARIPSDVIAAGAAMPSDGAISGVIEAGDGFFLVKRIAAREPATAPLETVAPRLRAQLLRDKRSAAQRRFEQQVETTVGVTTYPERLSGLDVGTGDEPPPPPPPR